MNPDPQASPVPPPRDTPTQAVGFWLAVIGLLLAGVWGFRAWRDSTAPKPPVVSTERFEPLIRKFIERAVEGVRARPRSGEAWGRLGMTLLDYEFFVEARRCFVQAEEFSSKDPRWPYFHGLLLFPDESDAGIAKLERSIRLCSDRPDMPRLRLARIYSERGRWAEAEKHFRRLIELRPDHPLASLGLGKLALEQNRLAESEEWLRRAATSRFSARNAEILLASLERRLNRPKEAERLSIHANELPPDEPWPDPYTDEAAQFHVGRRAWLDQAQDLLRRGHVSQALHFVSLAANDHPEVAEVWLLMGRVQMARKDYRAAEAALRKNVQFDPQSLEGISQLGVALLYQDRREEADLLFRKAIAIKPELGEAHFNLGLSLAAQNKVDEAIQSFRDAVRYKAGLVEAYIGLAEQLNRKGQAAEALEQLEKALQINATDRRVLSAMERIKSQRPSSPF